MWLLEASINKINKQSLAPGAFDKLAHHTIHHSENNEDPSDDAAHIDEELAELVVLPGDLHSKRWELKGHLDLLASDLSVFFFVLGQRVGPRFVVTFVASLRCVYKDMGHKFKELEVVIILCRFLLFFLKDEIFVKKFLRKVEHEVVRVIFEPRFNLLQVLGLLSVELEFLKVVLQT